MLCEFTSSMIFSKRRLLNSIFIFCFQITFLFLYMYISHKQKHLFTQQLILFLFIFNQIQLSHNKRVTFASVQIVLIVSFVCATNIASLRLGFGWLLVGAARLAGFCLLALLTLNRVVANTAICCFEALSKSYWKLFLSFRGNMLLQRDDRAKLYWHTVNQNVVNINKQIR